MCALTCCPDGSDATTGVPGSGNKNEVHYFSSHRPGGNEVDDPVTGRVDRIKRANRKEGKRRFNKQQKKKKKKKKNYEKTDTKDRLIFGLINRKTYYTIPGTPLHDVL